MLQGLFPRFFVPASNLAFARSLLHREKSPILIVAGAGMSVYPALPESGNHNVYVRIVCGVSLFVVLVFFRLTKGRLLGTIQTCQQLDSQLPTNAWVCLVPTCPWNANGVFWLVTCKTCVSISRHVKDTIFCFNWFEIATILCCPQTWMAVSKERDS